jgi:proteic killer suppression protein
MSAASYRLHALKGSLAGVWSVTVNGNWRVTFRFEELGVILVNYEDYH